MNTIILGLGKIGAFYDIKKKIGITHASSILKNNKVKLIAGVDKDIKKRIKFKKIYNIKVYKKIEEINSRLRFDLLVITFKVDSRYLKKIINNNSFKFILFEKPFNYNDQEFKLIKKLLKKKKINYLINFQRNFSPYFIELKKKIISKNLGKNIKIICYYSKNFLSNGVHFLAFFLNYSKSIKNFNFKNSENFSFETDKYEIFFIKTNNNNYNYNSFEIFGTKGKVKLETRPEKIVYYKIVNDKVYPKYKVLKKTTIRKIYLDNQKYIYNFIYKNLNNKKLFRENKYLDVYLKILKKIKNEQNKEI